MSLSLPKCEFCKRFTFVNTGDYTCELFPDGIPEEKLFEDDRAACKDGMTFDPIDAHATRSDDLRSQPQGNIIAAIKAAYEAQAKP